MTAIFAVALFLSISLAPEGVDKMTLVVPPRPNAIPEKITFERSADGWHVLSYNEKTQKTKDVSIVNIRVDMMIASESKDSDRIIPYLEARDKTKCNDCYIHLAKTCSVHGDIPGIWVDMNMLLEKPDNGWSDAGTLRIFDANPAFQYAVKYNISEDKNGLYLTFSGGDAAMRWSMEWFMRWHTAEKPADKE